MAEFHDNVRMRKGVKTTDSKADLIVHVGEEFSHEVGKWIHRELRKDRANDLYEETITDIQTGALIYRCREPLSEHQGHGSAKKIKTKP
jgi:hypothetical protein